MSVKTIRCYSSSHRPTRNRRSRKAPHKVFLYRIAPHNGGLVFAPKDVALTVANLHRALKKGRTWAEFRNMVSRVEYSRILRCSFDQLGERRPRSTDLFSPDDVAGWAEGDYPAWLQQEMDRYLPGYLLRRFGARRDTILNGSFWMVPAEHARPMIAAMQALGIQVESGHAMDFW